MAKEKISVIIPCYNEEEAISLYYEEMSKIMEQMAPLEFELLFIECILSSYVFPFSSNETVN